MAYLFGDHAVEGGEAVVWMHWIIDGWFPLLPWVPLGFCGIVLARYYSHAVNSGFGFFNARFIASMVGLVGLGVVLSVLWPSPFYIRHGYVELFYPATPGFLATAIGTVGLLLALSEISAARLQFRWFQLLGSMTLAMYTLHLTIIGHVLSAMFYPIPDLAAFYGIFAGHIALLALCASLIKFARETFSNMPLMVKWLVGK